MMAAMDAALGFVTFALMGLLVPAPAALVWLARSRLVSGGRSWLAVAAAVLGPSVVVYLLVVAGWLFRYDGRCGGWLGETHPCPFSEYAVETLSLAGLILAMPAAAGILLGVAVAVVQRVRSGPSRRKT
jgi:hypothetical protein